ncbi:MAG TPA: ATP-binding protein [Trueperaceae bacterium]|nr:ATP-binding protein [Trueperaceae bacterium]
MDPRTNPFAPGAGTPPPELAGRDGLVERAQVALARNRRGLPGRGLLLSGMRGVGKTVLLNRFALEAEAEGMPTCAIEAPEARSLPSVLAPALREPLLRLDRRKAAGRKAGRALRALGSFVKSLRVSYGELQFGLDLETEPGVADTGDLEIDLSALLMAVGEAAGERDTAFVLLVDELQYVAELELSALLVALHRCAQRRLPVAFFGAGLPQMAGRMGRAKSYAERMFDFVEVGALNEAAARVALEVPAEAQGAGFTAAALHAVYRRTEGYPYFLQTWGKHAWDVADSSPISKADVDTATGLAIAELDASFFRVRLDRLTPSERTYLRAMAEMGPGPHRSGEIAAALGRKVTSVAPTRAKLIAKGVVYSPSHGLTAFTVPWFDAFIRRTVAAGEAG